MDIQDVITIVNNVGFPIAVCGALMYFIAKIVKPQNDMLIKFGEIIASHTEAIKAQTEVIVSHFMKGENDDK